MKTSIFTAYSDPYQLVVFDFQIIDWSGEILRETNETIDAGFFPLDEMPEIADYYHQTIRDLDEYNKNKQIILR